MQETLLPGVRAAQFVVAEEKESGEIVGTIGVADESAYPIAVRPNILREAFGTVRGTVAGKIMKDELYQPRTFRDGQAHVSFVAVRKRARGHHLAAEMLQVLLRLGGYALYTLDVVEGNEKVIPIYEGAGFVHNGRKKERGAFLKGFSFRYLMEYRPR